MGSGHVFRQKFRENVIGASNAPYDPGSTFWAGSFKLWYVEIWIWNVSDKWPPNLPKMAKIDLSPTLDGAVDNTTLQLIIISIYQVTDDPWPCFYKTDFCDRINNIPENAISKNQEIGYLGFMFRSLYVHIVSAISAITKSK